MPNNEKPYVRYGNKVSDQAEASSVSPLASQMQTRILIELQVISMLLHQQGNYNDDLAKLRQDVADSIT